MLQWKTFSTFVDTFIKAADTEALKDILEEHFSRLPDLAKELGKESPKVQLDDGGIRLATEIIPILKDVFMHIFHNAIDHGLESAEKRRASGKTAEGTIFLQLRFHEDQLLFKIFDDGQGLDLQRLREKAQQIKIHSNDIAISDEEAANLIFHSGLSTALSYWRRACCLLSSFQ